ncbi:MAG: zinc ribbon domain-containing protein [bacterium]|nr:zinc ribbon domain-containing protein [bacterium]
MYCKNCGRQIADDSRFCSDCGALQKQPRIHHQEKKVNLSAQGIEKFLGIELSKRLLGFYLIWVSIHLILLLVHWNDGNNKYFWPISKRADIEDYDFSEFILFAVFPVIGLAIINLFRDSKSTDGRASDSKYDMSYEKDVTPTIVGVFMLVISFGLLMSGFGNDDYGRQQGEQIQAFFSVLALILRIVFTVWVVNIAKQLNRDSTTWGIFCFFFPSIALIAIGQMRKLRGPS